MFKKRADIIKFSLLLATIVLWSIVFSMIGVDRFVSSLGRDYSYVILFFVALVFGFTSLTYPSFFASFIALSASGLNPLLLGILAGVGITFGDLYFFYIGNKGKSIVSKKHEKKLIRFAKRLDNKPKWLVPFIIFAYTTFSPFPNEVIMIGAALIEVPFKKVFLPILLGNVVYLVSLSYLISSGMIFL